jgi:pyruvate ferredoxin oxidoreductase gamma subunit/phenylglyoxylate dehydrogenase gamma subunit
MQTLGRPITNTAMLGAFAAATGLVSTESLEKGLHVILSRFSEDKLARNVDAIKAGYDAVKKSLA